jgi:hypothetical protein
MKMDREWKGKQWPQGPLVVKRVDASGLANWHSIFILGLANSKRMMPRC